MVNIDRPEEEYWFCIIGPANLNGLPEGLDFPMRVAVERAFVTITGHEAKLCSSGWGITEKVRSKIEKSLYEKEE